MFCPHCGAQISDRARFCGLCGQSVAAAPPAGGGAGATPPPPPDPFYSPPGGYPPPGGGYTPPPPGAFPPSGGFPPLGGPPPYAVPPPPFVPPASVEIKTGQWIGEGWEVVKADMGGMILVTLVFMLINSVIPLVLTGPTMIGVYMYCSKRLLRRPAELGDLFKGFPWFVPSLVATLLIGLFVNIGMILCVIPGLVVAAMYMFTFHFIFDRGLDFWPAMQASAEVAKKNLFGFTMFFLVLGLLNILGMLLCIVGLFVTVPITYVAVCAAYRDCVGFDPALQWTEQRQ